ncbi:MAG: lysophospholipid acyltransferase family protein [Bernardetiaceae bacterium]
MERFRAWFRLGTFAGFSFYYISKVALSALLLGDDRERALRIRQDWARRMLVLLGIRLRQEGQIPEGNYLILSNHRTYIDPVLILSHGLASVVAKAEVSRWALIGWGVRVSHVVLVQRQSRQSRQATRNSVQEWLESGFSLLIFPEGTTHAGPGTLPLKPGMFKLAAEHGFGIIPTAISYREPGDAWVGDDTFIRHFLQCFAKPTTEVWVVYGQPIFGTDAQALQNQTQNWITERLKIMDSSWTKPNP